MAGKIRFILGIHNHQPVGNFDHVIEEAYQRAYLPFIEVMEDYPDIPFALHNSGILWDWFEEKHPEYIERISKMAGSGSVELMSAGYYEPILTVIPERDRQGQLSMMNDYLAARFGAKARGCWLTERIWDPHLPDTLARAGLQYVIVDDSHFKSTGLVADQMRGYFLSEENGAYISVFPIDKKMRYLVPFHDPAEIIEYFRGVAAEGGTGDRVVVLADDGEKFGLWPGTHSLCYEETWLRRFCDVLRENSDWIEVTTFSPVLDSVRPLGIVYLPTASYSEMMEWALPLRAQISYHRAKQLLEASGDFPEAAEAVRGGLWRNFLVKYEESNWMHKRMLGVSAAVEEAIKREMAKPEPGGASADVENIDNALSHLYQAQCNCAYWHGLFGGLYLPHLRSAIFSQLIQAENTLQAAGPGSGDSGVSWAVCDIDGDGVDEVAISTASFRAWLKAKGGTLRELDSLDPPFNVTDTLTRREEYYHRDVLRLSEGGSAGQGPAVSIHDMAVAKENGLEKILLYDRHPRACLVDHFISRGEDLESAHSARYEELGDFVTGIYSIEVDDSGDSPVFHLGRDGSVSGPGGTIPVSISKKISIDQSAAAIEVEYSITAGGNGLDCRFAVESVFSMLAGNAPDRYFTIPGRDLEMKHLASSGAEADVGVVTMTDEWLDLSVTLDIQPSTMLWRFPVETVSNSDSGFERVYQGSSLLPVWDLKLDEGESAAFRMRITLGSAGEAGRED